MKKPNLFIVGAPKAGTTFLYEKLRNHPDLYFPKIKELNYFSFHEVDTFLYYHRYEYKVDNINKYLDFYKDASSQKYLVDTSVSYFSFENVAQRIAEFNKSAKIVIILRDPVKRAVSHYSMDKRMGFSDKPLLNYVRQRDEYPAHYFQYIENSRYIKNIKRYSDAFGSDNVCVMKLENLEKDLSELFEFLGIEDISISINTDEKVNPKKEASNNFVKYLLKNFHVIRKMKPYMPSVFIEFFKSILFKKSIPTNLSDEERKVLEEIFENELKFYYRLS